MELFEMFGWVVLGFLPTYGVLEMAYRKLGKTKRSRMTIGRHLGVEWK
ncbi:MAG: hypothetical protein M3530_05950 [Thermoproteota archaeon]|nr:hypothetical protein [Thermoproteota archaeon]